MVMIIQGFFHLVVNWRRKVNAVRGINIQGEWVDDPKLVKREIQQFFEKRFCEEGNQQLLSFEVIQFNKLNDTQASKLVETFLKQKLKRQYGIMKVTKVLDLMVLTSHLSRHVRVL